MFAKRTHFKSTFYVGGSVLFLALSAVLASCSSSEKDYRTTFHITITGDSDEIMSGESLLSAVALDDVLEHYVARRKAHHRHFYDYWANVARTSGVERKEILQRDDGTYTIHASEPIVVRVGTHHSRARFVLYPSKRESQEFVWSMKCAEVGVTILDVNGEAVEGALVAEDIGWAEFRYMSDYVVTGRGGKAMLCVGNAHDQLALGIGMDRVDYLKRLVILLKDKFGDQWLDLTREDPYFSVAVIGGDEIHFPVDIVPAETRDVTFSMPQLATLQVAVSDEFFAAEGTDSLSVSVLAVGMENEFMEGEYLYLASRAKGEVTIPNILIGANLEVSLLGVNTNILGTNNVEVKDYNPNTAF